MADRQRPSQISRFIEPVSGMSPIIEEPASRASSNTSRPSTFSQGQRPPRAEVKEQTDKTDRLKIMDVTSDPEVEIKPHRPSPAPSVEKEAQTDWTIVEIPARAPEPAPKTPKTPENKAHKGTSTDTKERIFKVVDDDLISQADSDYSGISSAYVGDHPRPRFYDDFKYVHNKINTERLPLTDKPKWTDDQLHDVIDKYVKPLCYTFHPAMDSPKICMHCEKDYPAHGFVGVVKIQRGRRQIVGQRPREMTRRSMAELPKSPVINVGVLEDDPHLHCVCDRARSKSPELTSETRYYGYVPDYRPPLALPAPPPREPAQPSGPIYPLNTESDVFPPGPSSLYYPGGIFDRDSQEDTEDYKRYLQTHKKDEPLAAGEYNPSLLSRAPRQIMSDDVTFAAYNYQRAMEKLGHHIDQMD